MGCGSSKKTHISTHKQYLTEEEKHDIKKSWKYFTLDDMVESGYYIFFYIFKKHPETKRLFHFIDEDDDHDSLKANHRFRCHVGLFCETIRIAVEEMRDIEDILLFLKDLGRKHKIYGATPKYIQTAGEGIIYAIDRKLGTEFTRSMKTSWKKFYKILQGSMVEGLEFG